MKITNFWTSSAGSKLCHAMRSLWNCTWVSRYFSPGASWKMRAMGLLGLLAIMWNKNFYWHNLYIGISFDDWELWKLRKDVSINCQYQLQKCVRTIKEIIACINHYYLIFGLSFIKSLSCFNWAHVRQRYLLHFKNPLVQNRNVIILPISGLYWAINSVLLSKWFKTFGIHLVPVLIGSIRETLEGSYSTSMSPYDSSELNSEIRINVQ